MSTENVVSLLYSARSRFTTIAVTWQYRYDVDGMNAAQTRWVAENPSGRAVLTSRSAHGDDSSRVINVYRRLWAKPACWRDEEQIEGGGTRTAILCDGHWWNFSSDGKLLVTNEMPRQAQGSQGDWGEIRLSPAPDLDSLIDNHPLLDPSFLLASHELQPLAQTSHAGRAAIRVQAVYRKRKDWLPEAFFWSTADTYELLVDRDYGILLRYAAVIDGQEFAVSSVDQVTFDEPISDEVFAFPSPPDRLS